jgi:hypothetical protein
VISAKGDPLETIKKIVPWEDFRADIEAATEAKPEQRKSNAGRKLSCKGAARSPARRRPPMRDSPWHERRTPLAQPTQ